VGSLVSQRPVLESIEPLHPAREQSTGHEFTCRLLVKETIQWKDTKAGTIFRVGLSCYTLPRYLKGGDFTPMKNQYPLVSDHKYPRSVA